MTTGSVFVFSMSCLFLAGSAIAFGQAQTPMPAAASATGITVPRLVSFSGVVHDGAGKPVTGRVAVMFSLYAEQEGGTPLWSETQLVQADTEGHYAVFLGATEPTGLPLDAFTSGAARWLGVQSEVTGTVEAARILLVGVPYALKAADADTLGGKPASAFVTTDLQGSPGAPAGAAQAHSAAETSSGSQPAVSPAAVGGSGTTNYVPLWLNSTTLGNSPLFQMAGNVGLGTTTPDAKLEAVNTSSAGIGVHGAASSTTGTGVKGAATATSGSTFGVIGADASSAGVGVFGNATSKTGSAIGVKGSASAADPNGTGVVGSGTVGVFGQSTFTCQNPSCPSEAGVKGIAQDVLASVGVMGGWSGSVSSEGQSAGASAGVWADSGGTNGFVQALLATADNAVAVEADNNTDNVPTMFITNFVEFKPTARVFETLGFPSGGTEGTCTIDVSGDLTCTGTKSAAVPLGNGRKVALYAVEAPENWFEDFGSGKLVDGIVTIRLESTFAQTVNTDTDYHVFLTPNGDCHGLYVSQKTPGSFEVRELGGGRSNASFDYRIVARRKGYENLRLADVTSQLQHPRFSRKPLH